jgi:hypothetical protein
MREYHLLRGPELTGATGGKRAMSSGDSTVERILHDLRERAKELSCLYAIEELTARDDLPLEQVLEKAIQAIPPGWQYPDMCSARIILGAQVFGPPGFEVTPFVQRAVIRVEGEPAGDVEVYYSRPAPQSDEGPFLKEERRLIETIAERIGSCITHRRLVAAIRDWKADQPAAAAAPPEWAVIVALLRRTDQALLNRIARKMINHLAWSGVPEADALLQRLGARPSTEELLLEHNRPVCVGQTMQPEERVIDEAFRLAAARLSSGEVLECIHRWIKQDRSAFLVTIMEDKASSLTQIGEALDRYVRAAGREIELPPATLKGLRASLTRRLMSGQPEFISVACRHLELADFHGLLQRTIHPSPGHGQLGGKSAGLILAQRILAHRAADEPLLAGIRVPRSWYLTSDALHEFIYGNHLEDVFTHKYRDIDDIRREYPGLVQLFKHSHFSPDLVRSLSVVLDELGQRPLIVRSSSLLEDRSGAAFSGKYKSLFLGNQGPKAERLEALLDAIAEVYASTFGPDPIQYRAERNLLDFDEGMGVLIQEVVGTRCGDYFVPTCAGVAFSLNEIRWSPRLARDDGLMRIVPGLGTRAVDRVGDDYPVLLAPAKPELRVNASVDEAITYSPRHVDVINLRTNLFETVELRRFLRAGGATLPGIEQVLSLHRDGRLLTPLLGQIGEDGSDAVVTFEGLISRTDLVSRIRVLLRVLAEEMRAPVDIEFASDGADLYLLQCRVQAAGRLGRPAPIPRDIPETRVIFSARRHVPNGVVSNITHIVYVDPAGYLQLGSRDELLAVGRAVSRLNKRLPKRRFILLGPGRWGSRGDIRLGVPVTYSDINHTAMLIEIARRSGGVTPDVSFGTHFFQDLVEAAIRYLPLYPDDEQVVFRELFFTRSPNILGELLPEFRPLQEVVRVIDVPASAAGCVLNVLMNEELSEAVGVLVEPEKTSALAEAPTPVAEAPQHQYWRWRLTMAERIAEQIDRDRFGVVACYVFGSTENATAGPGSDIDLLIHFRGTDAQRAALLEWLDGWSRCLAEINFLRTGYRTDGLLDAHLVTDDDIARRTSFAAKIGAVTDAARPLRIGAPPS